MPSYEVRYLNDEGELALIHKTHHENDDAVDQAAYRMLVGSGFSRYEIWREEDARLIRDQRGRISLIISLPRQDVEAPGQSLFQSLVR